MKTIQEMAREAGLLPCEGIHPKDLEAFAALVREEAQPQQEPVAWYCKEGLKRGVSLKQENPEWIPLYTFPPQSKPLTDKQILADETLRYYFGLNGGAGPVSKQGRKIVNAIEAAHGIKGAA